MTKRSSKKWPPKMAANLVALWEAGRTGGQIAEALGVTRSAALGKLFRMGMLGRRNCA